MKTTDADRKTIRAIASRAVKEGLAKSDEWTDIYMDIDATHGKLPLDLEKLHGAPLAVFAHDVDGINKHLDRATFKLTRGFLPKCAVPQTEIGQ